MKISLDLVEKTADLACLTLTKEELPLYQNHMKTILSYMETLEDMDVNMSSLTSSKLELDGLVERIDKKGESLSSDQALKNAPVKSGYTFKVPRIVE